MKSIIIAGIARAGKTTTCSKLCKKGYNHWTCDSLIATFEKIFPEHEINQGETTQEVKDVSKRFSPFLNTLIKTVNEEYLDYPTVFDIYQLMPKDYIENIEKEYADIYFLAYPDITVEEEFKILRNNNHPQEYTQKYTDEYLKEVIKQRIEESKYIQKECEKYNLPFINTSYNREEKIEELVNRIIENIM